MATSKNDAHPASPCTRNCGLDASGARCTGCQRSIQEITAWSRMTPAEKQAALDRIAALPSPLK